MHSVAIAYNIRLQHIEPIALFRLFVFLDQGKLPVEKVFNLGMTLANLEIVIVLSSKRGSHSNPEIQTVPHQ